MELKPQMNTDNHRDKNLRGIQRSIINILSLSVSICVYLWLILFSSCSSKPTDLRTLVPADTLVYLETNELAAALQPIVDSKPFTEVAKSKPDFSALKGVQLAVAVTGFETTEEKLTDESSVGRVQPHFVAVADTHAWNYQAVGFAEKKLGDFVGNIYNSEPTLEKSDKNGGKYFTWTAKDGRKAYALVIDSLIYFGNDESSIEKCLAVKRGETDSIAKTGKVLPMDPKTLASGYVSTDGIAQIANIIGLKFASEAGEDSEVQSAIAGILPQLLRNSVTEISWASTKTDQGIEDNWQIRMPAEIAGDLTKGFAAGNEATDLLERLPADTQSVTVYNLEDPLLAWSKTIITLQKLTDGYAFKAIGAFAPMFFEPYGIRSPEAFLASINSIIITARFDIDGEQPIVMAHARDVKSINFSLLSEMKPSSKTPLVNGIDEWRSANGDLTSAFLDSTVITGNTDGVVKVLSEKPRGGFGSTEAGKRIGQTNASVITFGRDADTAGAVADLMSEKKSDGAKAETTYFTETSFTKTGIERRTVSDFGLIGSIIAQLAQD